MSELGAWLRESRETKELSLTEAAAATHIRVRHLSAIEEGRRSDLPDAVYLRGLVLTYGQYLGADAEELRALYTKEYGRPTKSPGRVDSHQPLSEPIASRRSVLIAAVLVLLVLAVVAALWWFWPDVSDWGKSLLTRMSEPSPRATATLRVGDPTPTAGAGETPSVATEPPEVAAADTPSPAATPTSAALPLPTPAPSDTPIPANPTPTATSTPVPGIWLGVQVSGAAWMRVTVDGEIAYEGTMEAGDAEVWFGERSLTLLTGNAGGTSLTLNGEPIEPLGAPGEVASMTWSWDGQQLTSTPGE